MSATEARDAAVVAAYAETGSIWLAAAKLGISGQTVQNTLVRLNVPRSMRRFTDADKARLLAEYETYANQGKLADLAAEMGRTRHFLCRQAKALGITARDRARPYFSEPCSVRAKAQIAKNGHPRGFQGHTHTAKARATQGMASLAMWASLGEEERAALTLKQMRTKVENGTSIAPERPAASWKAGWREIDGQRAYFRSAWEANYARYLGWMRQRGEILEWKHEPEVFWFEAIKQGVRSYKPDFRVVEASGEIRYHEVKGWMDSRSRTCMQRMGKYHPSKIIILIDSKAYKSIEAQMAPILDGWEFKAPPKPKTKRKQKLTMAVPVQPLGGAV